MSAIGSGKPGFVYLNRDNAWLDFELRNVDIVDGCLRLTGLPAPSVPLPLTLSRLPPPAGPAGLAVAPDGTIFSSVPDQHVIIRVDGCDGEQQPVPCLGGKGDQPTRFIEPRGFAIHPGRRTLIVADSGNHRLQLFDLETFQLVDVWGDGGSQEPPSASDEPGRFDTPTDVAVDDQGMVYVVDRGNRRVQQFTAGGQVVRRFWNRLAAQATFDDLVNVAVVADPDGPAIHLLDRGRKSLIIIDPIGDPRSEFALSLAGDPLGLAVTGDAIYIGENGAPGRVIGLRRDGTVVGAAPGYAGPVAALALDGEGNLLVHPGWPDAPVPLALDAAYVRSGLAWGGPFGRFTPATKRWHSLRATMVALAEGAHIQFFVHTTNDPVVNPVIEEAGTDPFPASDWMAGPDDLESFLIDRLEASYLWVGMQFSSEGATSPLVEQIRIEFDHLSSVAHLPAIFSEDAVPDAFLPRYLALAESLFADVEAETDSLTRLLDPLGGPEELVGQLARWLGLDISPDWDDASLRDAIRHAYAESANRGTARGLREAVHRYTGVDVSIEEPIQQAGWWALAADETSPLAEQGTSILGVTTMLVAAEPQGAVLGSTATINRSHLIGNDEYGAPLFEGLAHRFMVRLHQGATASSDRSRAVEALIEREKPAHTDYQLCQIEPRFVAGMQSRIGIDAIVGGDPLPSRFDDDGVALGVDLVLGGDPPGRIGDRGEIGVTTLLGPAAVGD
ncbi:MAG: phage tail protein [Chloroflexota bacterium]|nr:phage tail protein [Chloroflexota bacterium]